MCPAQVLEESECFVQTDWVSVPDRNPAAICAGAGVGLVLHKANCHLVSAAEEPPEW